MRAFIFLFAVLLCVVGWLVLLVATRFSAPIVSLGLLGLVVATATPR